MAAELQARAQAYLASKKPFLGLKVKTAPDKTKLIVTKITKRGPADLAGVREAGPIFEIKGQTVSTVEEFNRIVDDVRIGDVLDFRIGDSEVVKVLVGMEKESARALASLLRIAAGNIQAGDETMKQLEYTASNGVSVAKAPVIQKAKEEQEEKTRQEKEKEKEREKKAQEDKEKKEKEKKEKEEQEKKEREEKENEKKEKEEQEKKEREEKEKEKKEEEKEKKEREKKEKEKKKEEQERKEREKKENEKREREKKAKEEQESKEREKKEKERREGEKKAQEEQEKKEREKREQDKQAKEREKKEKEKEEREKKAKEEREKKEREKQEQEKREKEKKTMEEREKKEKERKAQESKAREEEGAREKAGGGQGKKKKGSIGLSRHAAACNEPDVEALLERLRDIERSLHTLSPPQVKEGAGSRLQQQLKAILPDIKNIRALHPQESQRAVDYYNELTKELPKRVNKLAQEVNKATLDASQDQSPYNHGLGADICVSCRKALSGQTVEAVNCLFHPACFKCYKCARPFTSADKPINIRDEPFCDSCSKGAFLAAMKTHGSAMLTPS